MLAHSVRESWDAWAGKTPAYAYANFAQLHPLCFCWACGRDALQRWPGWFAPWLLHRAHIYSMPRKKDARVAVLLCPLCHAVQHGERIPAEPDGSGGLTPGPTVAQMVGLKRVFDPDFYDPDYMQRCSVRRVSEGEPLADELRRKLLMRRGDVWTPRGTVRELLEG